MRKKPPHSHEPSISHAARFAKKGNPARIRIPFEDCDGAEGKSNRINEEVPLHLSGNCGRSSTRPGVLPVRSIDIIKASSKGGALREVYDTSHE
jgi:hypothetical protein